MSGASTSVGHPHPRPCSGKKTLRKCRNKEKADKVILIDVDSGIYDNVVIIDVPDSFPKRNQDVRSRKKDKKWLFKNVINLDDDETPESSSPLGANNVGFSASTPLNRESFHVAEEFGDSKDVQDSSTPVRLSKCKRTYSGKASTSNRYGLDSDSECDVSGNDYPDCEVMEDFSGKFQELWEKAVSRRKHIRSGIKGHDNTSSNINKDPENAKSENKSRDNEEASFCQTTGKPNNENGGSSPVGMEKDDSGFAHSFGNALNDQEHFASGKFKSISELLNCEPGSSSSRSGRRKRQASLNFSIQEESNKKIDNPICTAGDKENSREEDKDAQLLVNENCSSPVGDCITNEREKLKETEEYRKAMEEEWASRQEALRAQVTFLLCAFLKNVIPDSDFWVVVKTLAPSLCLYRDLLL